MDVGETIYEAIIREAKEELGIDILQKDLSLFKLMQTLKVAKPYNTAFHFFF